MPTLLRVARLLRIEDVILALLAGLVLPVVGRWLSGGAAQPVGDPSPLVGLIGLVAIAGVVAVVLTRGPDEPPPLEDGSMTLQGWARFPLGAGVAVVGLATLPGIGLDTAPVIAITFAAVFAGALVHSRLPVLPVPYRRAMVLPMTILAAGAFDQGMGRGLEDLLGAAVASSLPPEASVIVPFVFAGIVVLYAMLVVAPRSIADPGATAGAWVVRFVLLVASIAVAALLGIA